MGGILQAFFNRLQRGLGCFFQEADFRSHLFHRLSFYPVFDFFIRKEEKFFGEDRRRRGFDLAPKGGEEKYFKEEESFAIMAKD